MEAARTDTIGGFNAFLAEQVDDAGDVNVTLAQFDNEYEVVYLREPDVHPGAGVRAHPPPGR